MKYKNCEIGLSELSHIFMKNVLFSVCLTDGQIVKTLNELIEVVRKIWRELELNVSTRIVYAIISLSILLLHLKVNIPKFSFNIFVHVVKINFKLGYSNILCYSL